MKKLVIICFLCMAAGLFTPLNAQTKNGSINEKTIEGLMQRYNIPVLGIGIIKEGRLSHKEVYGALTPDEAAPLNTIFNVASLTKPLVTMLTLRLVSMGKWNLDEPLANYWIDPDVKNDSNAYKITTRHVLAHQTGFLNWRWLHASRKLSFDFAPGTNHQYSGEGFEYLRKALENKFGKSLEALCDTLVFKPLKMYDSRLTWKDNLEARFAKWHDQAGKNTYETFKSTKPNAADDLLTTVEDYSKFAMAVLSGFNLPDSLFKDMITPRATISKNSSMCLGWEYFGSLPNGEYAILHTGSDLGVKTLVLLFPRSKQGLVVFTNSDNGHLLYEKLIPLALGKLGETFMKTAF